jgi:hypothetical protein
MKKLFGACLIVFAVFAATAGSVTLLAQTSAPAKPRCRICPLYCIGVTCDDGQTYCNSCLAACAGAHNCTPGGV